MEKNRIHQVQSGQNTRMSFASGQDAIEMPDLIQVQKESYQWFCEKGLREIFDGISPIEEAYSPLSLQFLDYDICKEEAKFTVEECKERDATYAAPLHCNVRLINKTTHTGKDHYLYMGDIPLMTDSGSFVINGAERVIVSQIVRAPGLYFKVDQDKFGQELYTAQIHPSRGERIEFETDKNEIVWARIGDKNKMPATVILRALGFGTNDEICQLLGEDIPKLQETLKKDKAKNQEEGLQELSRKLRPDDPVSAETAETLFRNTFFDNRRYDLARVGRYKFNKKMNLKYRLNGMTLADDVIDPVTGEVLFKKDHVCTREDGEKIQDAAVPYVLVVTPSTQKEGAPAVCKVLSDLMVSPKNFIPKSVDLQKLGVAPEDKFYYPVLETLLTEKAEKKLKTDDFTELLRRNLSDLMPHYVTETEIIVSLNYLLNLEFGIGQKDDIDHLGNRRIRAVGELLQNQFRVGMSRMERAIRDKMSTADLDTVTPQSLINIKPVTAAVKEFFGSSQLSQFMDQNNPLSELTHKRRLSALGPGGLSRERAGFEVRDVHYTHYGRMCPIETPEGPNIGLINSLASFARIDKYGFIEAPYRVVDRKDPKNPVVTEEVIYLPADEEDNYVVAQANTPLDEKGHFKEEMVSGRYREDIQTFPKARVDLMDVSPRMVFSVATAMIPFLQNDDANRALMGSNMQRQAVPLMITEAPVVDTGLANKVAKDSGVCIVAKNDGVVKSSSATEIVVKRDKDGKEDKYRLLKFTRSNQSNSYNQRPIVIKGDTVKAGEIIADGPSTKNGEIALGKNPLIGFMTWEGYNYEDAVLLSERLLKDDVYTSIHIEEYEIQARTTKLGNEQITRDIPGVSQEVLKNLDENGIVALGTEVHPGDILVGKVTPKGETDMSPEERLLLAIFEEKAKDVRDTSLRLPNGAYGIVVDTKEFTKENNDELEPGVLKYVRIYIAQKRKISVGDKMAGRHGNKGVVSRILPEEDMPFLPNGRPLDIVLNPLGVPSRMNIGQILETHLSLAAQVLGINISTPVFDGATEKEIGDMLEIANDYANCEWKEFKSKYKDTISKDLLTYLESNLSHREEWKGVQISRDGKVRLRDGRTGEYFDGPVTIGFMHYLKLHHLVDDKIHARSIGPYSLVTQQPLGGKAQFGGQRFGEMEVWALEAYGASYTLQEILTVKSDDVKGRVKTYEAIVKGENIPKAGIPESFKVLVNELKSLNLNVKVYNEGNEVDLVEDVDVSNYNYNTILNEDTRKAIRHGNLADRGFQIKAGSDDRTVDPETGDIIEESDN